MLNLWRYVHYTDDGCSIFECLKCYGRWEGRSEPGYIHHETHQYIPSWHFCPICGTQWLGKRTTEAERLYDKAYGPRRLRIAQALEARRYDHFPFPVDRTPFFWQIEMRQSGFFSGSVEGQRWEVKRWIKGLSMPVRSVLAHARRLKQQAEVDAAMCQPIDLDVGEIMPGPIIQVRVTTSRTRPQGYELTREI